MLQRPVGDVDMWIYGGDAMPLLRLVSYTSKRVCWRTNRVYGLHI